MTEATVEEIARLMHDEALRWHEQHSDPEEYGRRQPFEGLPGPTQDRYRAVARAVLKALGR